MLTSEATVARLPARIPVVIVATPAYPKATSAPTHPSDLKGHAFVAMCLSFRGPNLGFRNDEQELTVPLSFEVSSNSPNFNREMVRQEFGIGLILMPLALVEKDPPAKALIQVLAEFPLANESREIWLAYSNRTVLSAKVRAFISCAPDFFGSRPD